MILSTSTTAMAMPPSVSKPAASAPTPTLRQIPGSYGPPIIGALRDRLDYFWFQGPEAFFKSRVSSNRSTVFRTNMPPSFPFFTGIDNRVVALVDSASFTALFDPALVDKRDVLIGPYSPGVAYTGGVRVGVHLDTEEPDHAKVKRFILELLRRSSRTWRLEFLAALDAMLAGLEADLAAGKTSNFVVPLQKCLFTFLCKSIVGADPAADEEVNKSGFATLDFWLALQLIPTQKIGVIPQPLEELLLHSFPLPFALVAGGYNKLASFVDKHGQEVLEFAAAEHGLARHEAVHNILFVLGFNAFGGFSVFLPSLITTIGRDKTGLRRKLRDEVRGVLDGKDDPSTISFEDVKAMKLVKSTVYEVLRMNPPVPLQFGRARRDFVLSSHEADFSVAKGELLCGYQPMAMRDAAVFERPEEFVPERFLGSAGEALLQYVYWSNGPETESPTTENKQCAGKEYVVGTACLLVAEMLRRYDDFECADDGLSFIKLDKAGTTTK